MQFSVFKWDSSVFGTSRVPTTSCMSNIFDRNPNLKTESMHPNSIWHGITDRLSKLSNNTSLAQSPKNLAVKRPFSPRWMDELLLFEPRL